MDCCLIYSKPNLPAGAPRRHTDFSHRRPSFVAASTRSSHFGGLIAPLEPRTPTGKFLTGVLLDDRDSFQAAARGELERLAAERDQAATRLRLSLGSDEACLHRRIAELKRQESQDAVQDVMYIHILHKFSKMNVHLVPKLSKCVCNGRLEIWPSKDWELESIHGSEALQIVREHLKDVIGCNPNANVSETWATIEVQKICLCQLYASSILYGYFLKTASLRHLLERLLDIGNSYLGFGLAHGRISGNLRFYMMGFDREMIGMCGRPKFKETVSVIEMHSCALFGGDGETGVIKTSFASLKRFLLEAVAFGSFLWEVEECVNDVYMLEEN